MNMSKQKMILTIDGAFAPLTDIEMDFEDKTRVNIYKKQILDEDIPVTVTISVDLTYISEYHQRKLQAKGWVYVDKS